MPSLSNPVFLNGWMTSTWIVYLGFNVVAFSTPVAAQPVPESSPEPESGNFSQKLAFPEPESAAGVVSLRTTQSNPANPASNHFTASHHTEIELAQNTDPRTQDNAQPVAVSAETCLADCNPTEQFYFNPPAIAIPPRSAYPRPYVAQSDPIPVPNYPDSANRAVVPPPPPSSANSFASQPVESGSSTSHLTTNNSADRPNAANPAATISSPSGTRTPIPLNAPDMAVTTVAANRPVTPPFLWFQGAYLYQGGEDSARMRVTGNYPILPNLQVGASLDFTEGNVFSESEEDGLSVNELYVAASIPNYPNLRLIAGQLDLTSYFDRNSFAKDSATQFFNPVFATNPALSAAGLGSRQGAIVNWTIIDELEVKAAVFSSDRSISDFQVNGFAGEVGARLGNFILRGTYITSEDAGANTGFDEIYGLQRSNGDFGLRDGDQETGYGLNAEYFIPEINLGLFARYGWYENNGVDQGATTYSFGLNLLDLFMAGDRLGVAYGRQLSSDDLRDDENPDVLEAFYDFRVFDSLRLGFTFQGLDEFSETIGGVRVRADFDLVPRRLP